MKLILPIEEKSLESSVCQSFGRANFFVLYDTETKKYKFIDNSAVASQGGAGIKAAQIIADSSADVIIAYQLGENAANVIKAAGIEIYKAQDASVNENITKYNNGELSLLLEIHSGFHVSGGEK